MLAPAQCHQAQVAGCLGQAKRLGRTIVLNTGLSQNGFVCQRDNTMDEALTPRGAPRTHPGWRRDPNRIGPTVVRPRGLAVRHSRGAAHAPWTETASEPHRRYCDPISKPRCAAPERGCTHPGRRSTASDALVSGSAGGT